MESWVITLFFVLPFFCAFVNPLADRIFPGVQRVLTTVMTFALLILTIFVCFYHQQTIVYAVGGWKPVGSVPIGIHLVLDGLSGFMLLMINLIGFFSAFYAIDYMKEYTGGKYFYVLICLMIAGMNGVVLSGDLFNMYVFMELAAKSSYALVAFGLRKDELEASFKYQVLGGMASLLILFGITMLYWKTSTLNMADISNLLQNSDNDAFILFVQLILITGFGVKSALIPFHGWLPDAHSSAPSPVSAILSGVLIKASGIYILMRLFINVFHPDEYIALVIATLGGVSMFVGALLAVGALDVKRLLAYSSISQVGYVVMGLGLGMTVIAKGEDASAAALTFTGALFHMFNHSVFKGLLFLNAGSVEYATGARNMKQMGGLAKYMPVTFASTFVASMSIVGIPPFNGFFSKLLIIVAAINGEYYFRAALGIIVGVITLVTFVKFQVYTFYGKPAFVSDFGESPTFMKISMISLVVLCFVLSILIIPEVRSLVIDPALDTLLETNGYSTKMPGS